MKNTVAFLAVFSLLTGSSQLAFADAANEIVASTYSKNDPFIRVTPVKVERFKVLNKGQNVEKVSLDGVKVEYCWTDTQCQSMGNPNGMALVEIRAAQKAFRWKAVGLITAGVAVGVIVVGTGGAAAGAAIGGAGFTGLGLSMTGGIAGSVVGGVGVPLSMNSFKDLSPSRKLRIAYCLGFVLKAAKESRVVVKDQKKYYMDNLKSYLTTGLNSIGSK